MCKELLEERARLLHMPNSCLNDISLNINKVVHVILRLLDSSSFTRIRADYLIKSANTKTS